MRLQNVRNYTGLAMILALFCLAAPVLAQHVYRNVVNTRFRTVSDGPQSAMIVDVPDPTDAAAVRTAVMQRYRQLVETRRPIVERELAYMRQHRMVRPGQSPGFADTVIIRSNGRLVPPKILQTRAPNDLTFNLVTSGTGAFSTNPADPNYVVPVQQLINLIYPQLRDHVLGRPGWNGTVTVRNLDPTIGKGDEVVGALLVVNGSDVEIDFPTFSTYGTEYLAMAQVIAQTFHGPLRTAYDAWEIGMARAAAVVVGTQQYTQVQSSDAQFNPANGFYYTPYYDLLNEPALGNNTFFPPTQTNGTFNATTLSGMLVPRLEMSATAWLKCYIENPNFLSGFNAAYYAAYAADNTIANDVNRLRELAAGVVPKVEMLPFDSWYEQQYVLDTSVTQGRKLYVYSEPTFPSSSSSGDAGANIFVVYYDTSASGDEINASGTGTLVYWDYNFQNRLALPSFESVVVTNGFGSVAPYFIGIGANPAMRLAIDVPINKEYQRVNFPANVTGTETSPTDFSGVVVGSDAGTLAVKYDGGTGTINVNVAQGVFSGQSAGIPNSFSRTQLIYTPSGGSPVTFQRNTAFNNTFGVSPIFVLTAPAAVTTLSHIFQTGPQMVSMPVRPLTSNLPVLFGIDPNMALIAQYRQDISNGDNYLRYPSLPLYQPGYAFWTNFPFQVNATSIIGEPADVQSEVTVALEYGWNQIGDPYSAGILFSGVNDGNLSFQYLGGDVVGLTTAISNGWIAAGITGFSPASGYYDITNNPPTGIPLNTLAPWTGYWIRVLVTEGVTLSYANPNGRAVPLRKRAVPASNMKQDGWRLAVNVQDEQGNQSSGVLGQASRGSDSFVPALDVASPPPFATTSTLKVRFPHPDWDTNSRGVPGEFLSDIRQQGVANTWNMTVSVPQPAHSYSLTWNGTARLPRGLRLTLVDSVTGSRTLMNTSSSLSFVAGKTETSRQFQIVAEPNAIGQLRISNVVAMLPNLRGRAAPMVTIAYELSAAAQTSVAIRLGGKLVRHILPGRAATVGLNQLVWDTRDDQGRTLPAGAYTLEISAHTPEGDLTRSVVPLILAR